MSVQGTLSQPQDKLSFGGAMADKQVGGNLFRAYCFYFLKSNYIMLYQHQEKFRRKQP